jgi:hypothetical protein
MSSSSTISTSTYVISKYSRLYPPAAAPGDGEWQHFTNPIMQLVLDTKKSQDERLESVRIRVIWNIDVEKDSQVFGSENMVILVRWTSGRSESILST